MATSADVPLLVRSENSASERRVTPAWSIATLKARLEPITGVPADCQKLSLKVGSQQPLPIAAQDEEATQIGAFPLQAYAELQVSGGVVSCLIPPYTIPLQFRARNPIPVVPQYEKSLPFH